MGEVIARDLLARRSIPGIVQSAGTAAIEGMPATDGAVMTVRRMGLDLSEHRSASVTPELVAGADLVVAMERQHLQALVIEHAAPLATTFTLPELATLLTGRDHRRDDEPVDAWLERVGVVRSAAAALVAPEITDPIGRSMRIYRSTARSIAVSLDRVLESATPTDIDR